MITHQKEEYRPPGRQGLQHTIIVLAILLEHVEGDEYRTRHTILAPPSATWIAVTLPGGQAPYSSRGQ